MRLLLRRNAHRVIGDEVEIAAAPDTPDRERWQWHVRVTEAPGSGATAVALNRENGSVSALTVATDPAAVVAEVHATEPAETVRVVRSAGELVVLVVGAGAVLVEDRHLLTELDAMVLAGEEPLAVVVEPQAGSLVSLATIRLSSATGQYLSWVP
jgi:hypothetical protein